jgi:hypothetical protein
MPEYTLFYITQAKKYFEFKGPNLTPYKKLNYRRWRKSRRRLTTFKTWLKFEIKEVKIYFIAYSVYLALCRICVKPHR